MRDEFSWKFNAALLTTVSACAALSGQASAQTQAPVEEVVITGSLIRGGAVVGVPVTTLGQDDFQKTGAITITDLLRSAPSLVISPSLSTTQIGGNFLRASVVDIHGLNAFTGSPRTLTLIDGVRYAYSGQNGEKGDVSFLPQLAISRVDVVATGASATYGSDAMAGVINVILRRNYDGAISQASAGTPSGGGFHWTFSQLYGRSWDSGNITLAFTHYDVEALPASARPDLWTTDFRPWGLDNVTSVRSTTPAVVSTGAPNVAIGTACTNCYSVPKGQNGVGLTWAALLANAGVKNQVSPFLNSDGIPTQQSNAISAVFDQDLFFGMQLFGEAYYSNRRGKEISPTTVGQASANTVFTVAVPTTNPYYPVGAPAGLQVSYNFATELPPSSSYFEINGRYSLGLTFELPYGWEGRVQGTQSAVNNGYVFYNFANLNNVRAALGTPQNIAAAGFTPAVTVTKPANVPFLNLFCDPTAFVCNTQVTLDYLKSTRVTNAHQILNQFDASIDGSLWTLPGGDLTVALGGSLIRNSFNQSTTSTITGPSAAVPVITPQIGNKRSYALFAELHIPIFGDANAIPMFRRLEVQLSGRYDNYDVFGSTSNPRVAIDWMLVDGLTLRGSYDTSFRAPAFIDLLQSPVVRPLNTVTGGLVVFPTCPGGTVGGTPVPGSFGAILNPTCSAALMFPGGIAVEGSADIYDTFERGPASPEKSKDYSLGFQYAPTNNFLSGLVVDVAYWNVNIRGLITTFRVQQANLLDPTTAFVFTQNDGSAEFAAKVATLVASPLTATPFAAGAASNVQFLMDGLTRNAGSLKSDGVDFSVDYTWAGDNLGDWNVGFAGTYYLHRTTRNTDLSVPVNVFDINNALDFFNGAVRVVNGQSQAVRLKYRGFVGWTMNNASVTAFVNYRSHLHTPNTMPPTAVLLASGITDYANYVPSLYTFDLALAYDLADTPANDYLKNLRFNLVVNNILDRKPPFSYQATAGGAGVQAFYGTVDSPIQRDFTFTITKTW